MKRLIIAIAFASLLLPAGSVAIFAAEEAKTARGCTAAAGRPARSLPKDIIWETDNDEPLIGSEKAIAAAPQCRHRLLSADLPHHRTQQNDFCLESPHVAFGLVSSPVTDKFIPLMATHWSVQKDQKTIYSSSIRREILRRPPHHRGGLRLHLEDDAVEIHR
jgi:hypothetical protein